MRALAIALGLMAMMIVVPGCTGLLAFNAFQTRDETVKQAYSKLLSVYQQRADLVPNLASVTKQFANHESGTFTKVAEARAGVAAARLPENPTQEQMDKFEAAQKELRLAMAGAMKFTAESNPTLTSSALFLKLQHDLKQIETQATAARNRYIREVTAYNVNIRSFPSNIVAGVMGYSVKPQLVFDDEKEIKHSPRVDFGKKG